MRYVILIVSILLVLATLAPFIPTSERWIRIFDFPRSQIALALVIALFAQGYIARKGRLFDLVVVAGLIAATGWQVFQIYPYTPLAPLQVKATRQHDEEACFRLLVANVLMENRNFESLLKIIRQAEPDVILFAETDGAWDDALQPLSGEFPHSVRQPQNNFYGMILYSRLELIAPGVHFLVDEEVPSIRTIVVLRSGERVEFFGVHPVPPPLADTEKRDAELLLVAEQARKSEHPVIVAGDLNDVGWSPTTRLFSRISRLLDPRIGRGFYASYNAKNFLLRWPLDHIFHHDSFTLREMKVLEAFGSDHFPVLAELCHEPHAQATQEAPAADGEDHEQAREQIIEGVTADPEPGDYPKPNTESRP